MCMDKETINIIDKFFSEHPAQLKPIHPKRSHLKKVERNNTNSDRSLPLKKPSHKNRADYNSYQAQPQQTNVLKFDKAQKRVELIPRNTAQEEYIDQLMDYEKRIVFAVGPAGTGKTLLAVLRAIKSLKEGEIEKIIITRPAVSVDEKHGFLPGTLNEKMEPWTRPIFDVFEEIYGLPVTKQMLENGIIEIAPLGFMRGRTFKRAYVIADEMQNATPDQMKMLLTRIGERSRILVTGDLNQHDRGFDKNGLKDFLELMASKRSDAIVVCKFGKEHIERDPVVSEVLDIYGTE